MSNFFSKVNIPLWMLTYLFLGYSSNTRQTLKESEVQTEKTISAPIVEGTPSSAHTDTDLPSLPSASTTTEGVQDIVETIKDSGEKLTEPEPLVLDPSGFSFLNLQETPWIILPKSLKLSISVQESQEISIFLEIFSCFLEELFTSKSKRDQLSEIIPGWLYDWLINVMGSFFTYETLRSKMFVPFNLVESTWTANSKD